MKLGHQFKVIIETIHLLSLKKWLKGTMKNWPVGTHLVMELMGIGVRLFVVGCK